MTLDVSGFEKREIIVGSQQSLFNHPSIVLIGVADTLRYLGEYQRFLEVSVISSGITFPVRANCILLDPAREVADSGEVTKELIQYLQELTPLYVGCWIDVKDLQLPCVRIALSLYSKFLEAFNDRDFTLDHGASLEFGCEAWQSYVKAQEEGFTNAPELQEMHTRSLTRLTFGDTIGIYGATKPDSVPYFAAGFAITRLRFS
jgi:hypothetical protein